jgi:hypothetical protein
VNLFYKKYSDLRPAYRNTFGELVTFPEMEEDRVRVDFNGKTAKGVEVYLRRDLGERLSWWLSYSYSEVRDDVASLFYYNEGLTVNYNREMAYPYDQPHTLYLDANYRFSPKWQLNVAYQVHTGWPYTEVFLSQSSQNGGVPTHLEAGEPWGSRHEVFKRLDLRLNRRFTTSRGTITAFIEVINALADENVRNYEWALVSRDGAWAVEKRKETWFGPMPSFGITYDFRF